MQDAKTKLLIDDENKDEENKDDEPPTIDKKTDNN